MIIGMMVWASDAPPAYEDHLLKADPPFWLYMLECDNGNFYTGYTKNLAIRYYQHKNGKQSAKYTRGFKPVKIAQCWRLFDSIGTALKIERYIKKQKRSIKENLIKNPEDLKSRIFKNLNLDLKISPFDCLAVETESDKMDWKKVRNSFDPFADLPVLTVEKDDI